MIGFFEFTWSMITQTRFFGYLFAASLICSIWCLIKYRRHLLKMTHGIIVSIVATVLLFGAIKELSNQGINEQTLLFGYFIPYALLSILCACLMLVDNQVNKKQVVEG
jgi:hypothetical protein